MRRKTSALVVLAGLLLGATARAEIPRTINFQGRLTDTAGLALTGNYEISFDFYAAATGATPCNASPYTYTLGVNAGLFNATIGAPSGISASCGFAQAMYLSIRVGTDAPMVPRIPMAAAPYAIAAGGLVPPGTTQVVTVGGSGGIPVNNGTWYQSVNADMLGGKHGAELAPKVHSHTGLSTVYSCASPWGAFLTNYSGAQANCSSVTQAGYFGGGWPTTHNGSSPVTAVSLTSSRPSPLYAGFFTSLSATRTGLPAVSYRLHRSKEGGPFELVYDWSVPTTGTVMSYWTPTVAEAGNYTFWLEGQPYGGSSYDTVSATVPFTVVKGPYTYTKGAKLAWAAQWPTCPCDTSPTTLNCGDSFTYTDVGPKCYDEDDAAFDDWVYEYTRSVTP